MQRIYRNPLTFSLLVGGRNGTSLMLSRVSVVHERWMIRTEWNREKGIVRKESLYYTGSDYARITRTRMCARTSDTCLGIAQWLWRFALRARGRGFQSCRGRSPRWARFATRPVYLDYKTQGGKNSYRFPHFGVLFGFWHVKPKNLISVFSKNHREQEMYDEACENSGRTLSGTPYWMNALAVF